MYEYLKGRCKGDRARFFSVVSRNRTKDHGHNLKPRMFTLDIRSCEGG